ncbi:MAG TPA: DUF5320 domain-containing protein [Methanoregulaceae archaeon]|nr:DUF5320 domain-containing protein [Methanoregulaceae archaeon]
MPGFNGTGPMGRGSRSGRGYGYCLPTRATDSIENTENDEGTEVPQQKTLSHEAVGIYGVGRGGIPRGCGRGFCGGGRGRRRF